MNMLQNSIIKTIKHKNVLCEVDETLIFTDFMHNVDTLAVSVGHAIPQMVTLEINGKKHNLFPGERLYLKSHGVVEIEQITMLKAEPSKYLLSQYGEDYINMYYGFEERIKDGEELPAYLTVTEITYFK